MDRLPYDYARFINDACPLRDRCLRATPGRSDGRQAFAAYPPQFFHVRPLDSLGQDSRSAGGVTPAQGPSP